jgi:STE24 endopeptidase
LNSLNWTNELPNEAKWIYDEEKYKKSRDYDKAKFKFSLLNSSISFVIIITLLLTWFFGKFYDYLLNFSDNIIILTLLFALILTVVQSLISLPFSYYSTFVIEQKFSFNKTDKKTFFLDFIKELLVSIIIWAILLSLITWIYLKTWNYFWILSCVLVTVFSIFMMMFYSTIIVPLFNKQTPLETWELRTAIEDFSKKVWFKLDNIYVIDGSKRSSKANAYFSGIGPKKRIVLFDTLINDMTTEELVAVLAHEIWHYKKKHTLKMLLFSIIEMLVIFYILSLFLKFPNVSLALWWENSAFVLSMLSFLILFTPISMIFWMVWNILSRKHEYEADAYSKEFYDWEKLKSALIKLSKNNLTNLTPHKAYEFFHYSHPNVLKRLEALEWEL